MTEQESNHLHALALRFMELHHAIGQAEYTPQVEETLRICLELVNDYSGLGSYQAEAAWLQRCIDALTSALRLPS